ncbi:MAG: hypothetical protein ABIR92_04810 [Gemmatimonadaceae bacterium]
MLHGSRNFAKAFTAFLTLGLAAACADNVAPVSQTAAFKAPANFNVVVGVQTFTVSNSQGAVQRLGDHLVYFPAGSICDPARSTYGVTEWDKPCTALQGSVTITATMMRDDNNAPYVDFQPALRFVPTKQVMLFMRNGRSAEPRQLTMKWCNNSGVCVDESINDPSLKPFRIQRTSIIGRRIKHFSGYEVAVGDPCPGTLTEEPDGTWMCYVEEGVARRSGYMVASGKDVKETMNDDAKKKESEGQ